jgi:hypothetical protein
MNQKTLTINDAQIIAEREISETIRNAEELQGYEFGPVRFRRENERFWVFSAGSRQLFEEGYVPGAIFACIDKVDGHVWSVREQEQYARSLSPIKPAKPTVDDALVIAQREIASVINNHERLKNYEFGPVHYLRETDRYWVFSAGSKQLMDEGRVPGAVSACIDKIDGHVWSREEQEAHERSRSQIEQTTQTDLAAA